MRSLALTLGVLSIARAHSAGPAEGNWSAPFALAGGLLQALAGLIGPGAVRGVAQVERPLFVGGFAFAAFFVGEREIEMDVGVGRHGAGGAAQMVHGLVEFAEFFQSASQVVARDAVERINVDGGEETIAGVGKLAQLVVSDAEIDVSLDPVRREIHDALIIFDRFRQGFGASLTIERGLEEILGSRADHGAQFRRLRGKVKRESPLAQKRIEGTFRAGGNDVNFAAELDEAKFLDRHGRGAKLRFHERDGAANAIGGNVILRNALDRAQGHQVAEAVESFAPAGFGPHQAQAFPVAKTVRLKTQDAPDFCTRITLRQSALPPLALSCLLEEIMHLVSTLGYGTGLWITSRGRGFARWRSCVPITRRGQAVARREGLVRL